MINSFNKKGYKSLTSFITSHYRTVLAVLAIVVIVWSCEEEPTIIGTGLLPSDDFAAVFSSDTFTVSAFTMYDDSVKSTDSLYLLGRRYNPYFGTTTAEFVTQLNLLTAWEGGGDFTIDSVELILSINDYEGDTLSIGQNLEMFEISEYLYRDSVYYSNKPVQIESLLGTFWLPGLKSDTTLIVKIPNSIGEHLMRDTTKLFISSTQPDFRDFFRGVYFRLRPDLYNVFFSLNTVSSTSGILVYWHNETESNRLFSFVLSDKSAKYKRIEHDFSTADPEKQIQHINDYVKDTLVYMQKLNGVYTRLEIPGLEQLKDMLPASVNKARLVFPVFLDDDDVFTANTIPPYLLMRHRDALGQRSFVPDMAMGQSYFGGYFNSESNYYSFNIAAFVQEYLEGRIDQPVLELYMQQGVDADLILKANDAVIKPRLEISMTKF